MMKYMMTLFTGVALVGCNGGDGFNGEYELREVVSNSCQRQPTIGDTLALQMSCEAMRQLEPGRRCTDQRVDMFMRVDSFIENHGRKSVCSIPTASGEFECFTDDSGHGWEGHVDVENSIVTLYYARGTSVLDVAGHAALTEVTCEMELRYEYVGEPNHGIGPLSAPGV